MKRKLLSFVLAFAMMAGLLTVGAGAAGPAYGDTAGTGPKAPSGAGASMVWSNRVLLSLNSRNPCSVGGVAVRSSEKCSSWLFSRPAAKYRKRRPKRTASASVVLCAFPFYKNFIHAQAPQPRDRIEVIYARKAPSRCIPSPAAGGGGFDPWRQRR